MNLIGLVILFLSASACAQNAVIKELPFKPNPKFYNTPVHTVIYPVVITKNKAAGKLINEKIRSEVLRFDNKKLSIHQEIINQINEGLTDLSYEITLNKKGILSLNVYREDCTGNCTTAFIWLNFDLKTGKQIAITDLVCDNKTDSLKTLVLRDKIKFLEKYKADEKKLVADKEIDADTYDWAISVIDSSCVKDVSLVDFSLSGSFIKIADPCEFPRIIRSQQPDYELKYPYKKLLAFLQPAWRIRLLK